MKHLATKKTFLASAQTQTVEYLTPEEVYAIADAVRNDRNGERNSLLILTLFETGLRISEALSIAPAKIQQVNGGYTINIMGKGRKPRTIACPEALADKLNAFAYKRKLGQDDNIFDIKRKMAWLMINKSAKKAGIKKRIYPHLFRHSDAIERLRQTGNPKALQLHLGHSSIKMTMRYLSTLSQEDAVRIQQQVRFEK